MVFPVKIQPLIIKRLFLCDARGKFTVKCIGALPQIVKKQIGPNSKFPRWYPRQSPLQTT